MDPYIIKFKVKFTNCIQISKKLMKYHHDIILLSDDLLYTVWSGFRIMRKEPQSFF